MVRRQVSKILFWENGGTLYNSSLENEKKRTDPFIFENCLINATITVRSKILGSIDSRDTFLNVNMVRKKFRGEDNNHHTSILSLPLGCGKQYTQTSLTLDVIAGEEVFFEVSKSGPRDASKIQIEIAQDVLIIDENSFSDFIGIMNEESTQFHTAWFNRVYGDRGGYLNKISFSILSSIQIEDIDGQKMVKIPKFYFKLEKGDAREGYFNKTSWLISEKPAPGFTIHPAFLCEGKEIDQFWIGAYESSRDGNKACSINNVDPWISISFTEAIEACKKRNTGDIDGFHMLTIYELAAVQILALIDMGSAKSQYKIGEGNCGKGGIKKTGTTDAVWRGISELWGNTFCFLDGIKTVHAGQEKYIHLFDKYGYRDFINTGISPFENSGKIYRLKENFGSKFDFRCLFIPDNIGNNQSYEHFPDYYYPPNRASHEYWVHGPRNSSGVSSFGLFALSGDISKNQKANNFGFRLAKV